MRGERALRRNAQKRQEILGPEIQKKKDGELKRAKMKDNVR